MNFGKPHLEVREPKTSTSDSAVVRMLFAHRLVTVRGQWWLWMFCSRWTLSIAGLEPVRSSGSRRRIRQALRYLDGQRLIGIQVEPADGRTRLAFDLGATMSIRALDNSGEEDLWSLYKPDRRVLSVRGDGRYCICSGKSTKGKYRPIPESNG
jgi:hypothetical protein